LGIIDETLGSYDPVPFDLKVSDFTDFALGQFQKRHDRIQRARYYHGRDRPGNARNHRKRGRLTPT
jgi:hypothetical protein